MEVIAALFSTDKDLATPDEIITKPALLSFDEMCAVYAESFEQDFVAVDTITLSDVLTSARLVLPCRSVHCTHLQCFEWDTYLSHNEQQNRHSR